jgi:hypothetical protein
MASKAAHKAQGLARQWWRTPLILALGRQRQTDLFEFKASLVYTVSSRTARAIPGKPSLKKTKTKPNQTKPNQTKNPQGLEKEAKTARGGPRQGFRQPWEVRGFLFTKDEFPHV